MKKRIILGAVAVLVIILISSKSIVSSAKVLMIVTEQFPQMPVKPLHRITPKPIIEKVQFSEEKIVGDLFIPKAAFDVAKNKTNKKPAIIVAMGVKTSDKDKPILLGFCESLARLGYVVLWPRSVDLEGDIIKFEEPQTFIDAFNFLQARDGVDKERISFVGFSVGSSLSLVAAENEKINEDVRSIVFFGGYYNILDYLSSLATNTIVLEGQTAKWEAAEGAIDHAKEILEKEELILNLFDKKTSLDPKLTERLSRFSPDQNIDLVKTKIFILHEKSDAFVPYTESVKLRQVLDGKGKSYDYHLASLFEHVQPKEGLSREMFTEILGFFVFMHKVFIYL